MQGDVSLAKVIIENMANISGTTNEYGDEHTSHTIMEIAISKGDFEMIRFLLEHGDDPNRFKILNLFLSTWLQLLDQMT